ncbi:MAG: DsrE family protein [Eubacteriales bacterium]
MDKLTILWVNDNPDTARLMVLMYAINGKKKGWWEEVEIIIWGASTKLVATDKTIQKNIKKAKETGVKISACLACASELGVVQELEALNIDVRYMGAPLTEILKNDGKLLTI